MLFQSTLYALHGETVHDKWCSGKSVGQTESDLERGFGKHWLNSVYISGPIGLDWQNNNSAHASRFFVHFFAVIARL